MLQTISKCLSSAFMQWVIVLMWGIWTLFNALYMAINLPTYHLDGAFQTASGLYRLEAGQFPGKDFYPYLGIIPLYVLYPAFKLFGSDLSASVFSAYFISSIVKMLPLALVWQLIWQPKSIATSLVAGSILVLFNVCLEILGEKFNLPLLAGAVSLSPGNSLKPLRSFAPYFAVIVFYCLIMPLASLRLKSFVAGCLTGLLLLWSNDYSISTSFIFGVLFAGYLLIINAPLLSHLLIYVASAVLVWVILFYLATYGQPISLLKYNFISVAGDQWWYFSPYGEYSRLYSIERFPRIFFRDWNPYGLVAIAVVLFLAWKIKSINYLLLAWIGISLFLGGTIACVGGHYDAFYFCALYYWAMALCIVGSLRFISSRTALLSAYLKSDSTIPLTMSGLAMCLAMLISMFQYKQESITAKTDSNRFFVTELGGYLAKEWYPYIELARNTPTNLLVAEEYWGIWSAVRKSFFIWPVDSVIHALGEVRDYSQLQLLKADLVISTRISTSKRWQPWSLSQNYWFYRDLFNHWFISDLSPTTVVWKRAAAPNLAEVVDCKPESTPDGIGQLAFNIPFTGLYEITIQYKITAPYRGLMMLQNNISFGADAAGYISIDPRASSGTFPAYFNTVGKTKLKLKTLGRKETSMTIPSCAAKWIDFHNKEVISDNAN